MQLLLAQHPSVVTSQETQLFAAYLSRFKDRWDYEVEPDVDRRRVGLSTVMGEAEFVGLCRAFADGAFARVHAERPEATILLEKSPNHAMHWRLVRRIYPEARFVVLYRDPRAVCTSLMAASNSWGADWAPDNSLDAVRFWASYVSACLELEASGAETIRIRYEDLQSDGATELARVFDRLDLETTADALESYLEATRMERLSTPSPENKVAPWSLETEPTGFYRSGRSTGWSDELSRRDVRRIEWEARDLMRTLGYEAVESPSRRPRGVRVRDLADRFVRGAAWRLGRVVRRL